jgi:nucleotide-binding universal stress UspA family protein
VALDVAALLAAVVLELAPRRAEGVAQGDLKVFVVLVGNDDLAAGHPNVDARGQLLAVPLVPAGQLEHHVAARDVGIEAVEFFRLLADGAGEGIGVRDAVQGDLEWGLHERHSSPGCAPIFDVGQKARRRGVYIGAMYKRILVPVDGSATSRRGLRAAIDLAKTQRARLVILNVVDAMPVFASLEGMVAYDPGILEALRKGGKAILARAAAEAKKRGVTAKTVLAENLAGRVADVIVRQAKRRRADLLVLGTHGRRGLTRMVMGSDAELVVRYTPAPVLLVRGKGRR